MYIINRLTLRVDFFGKFKGIAIRQVSVSWRHGKDKTRFALYKLKYHCFDLLFDVQRLISNGHFC